jgi:hypothetical protein
VSEEFGEDQPSVEAPRESVPNIKAKKKRYILKSSKLITSTEIDGTNPATTTASTTAPSTVPAATTMTSAAATAAGVSEPKKTALKRRTRYTSTCVLTACCADFVVVDSL